MRIVVAAALMSMAFVTPSNAAGACIYHDVPATGEAGRICVLNAPTPNYTCIGFYGADRGTLTVDVCLYDVV